MSGRAVIDGRPVALAAGDTILAAARRTGVTVPTLCHSDGLSSPGGCRLCIVERDGGDRPVAACHTPIADGDVIRTDTPGLRDLRRAVLTLQLEAAPAAGGGEIAALAAAVGVAPDGAAGPRPAAAGDHPYLRFDPEACVTCRRCVAACADIQGQFVYAVAGRGAATHLTFGAGTDWGGSTCVACGACVDACPTGAITDRDRRGAPATHRTASVCGYCGVGCRIEVGSADGRVVEVRGVPGAAVNRGHLCAKGRYTHVFAGSPDRLTTPLVRVDGELRPVSWDTAIAAVADGLRRVRDAHGPDAVGFMASSRSTNEACYLLQKLARAVLGTNNVDCCARVCHSSTAAALRAMTGTGAASACFEDIELARTIVIAGANPTEAHPVVGARIRQAVLAGARLVVVDPRATELTRLADVHVALQPGSNVAVANAVARVLLEDGVVDAGYLAERVDGLGALAGHLADGSLARDAAVAGVPESTLRAAARILADGPALFVHGLGLSELTQGVESVMAFTNLGLLTGSIGRPGAGMLPLRGQNNVQGSADMGAAPDLATGYQPIADVEVRGRLGALWGATLPAGPGLTVTGMTAAAASGAVRALWIQGEDIAQSDPHQDHVIRALECLDLLVVQELFLTETARRAHVVLPAAAYLEQDGTFTNGERRIQRVRRAVPPPGGARPDWEVVRDVAVAMGAVWDLRDPRGVMDDVARSAPALFGGAADAYDRPDGVQWPSPTPGHPGTPRLHTTGFARRPRLMPLSHRPGPEQRDGDFPYLLITGRVLQHYNVGTMTRRSPNVALAGCDELEINPADADREGVGDGTPVRVASQWGATTARARRTARVPAGMLFLSFHFPETHTNRLVGPHADPVSGCPAYKTTAVRLSPVGAAEGAPAGRGA